MFRPLLGKGLLYDIWQRLLKQGLSGRQGFCQAMTKRFGAKDARRAMEYRPMPTAPRNLTVGSELMEREYEQAIFAGGCFWCMVSPFDALPGVVEIKSGYTGGHLENPGYQDVKAQTSGHYEAVKIVFDPSVLSFEKLLQAFWMQIDPTDAGGQFHDRGPSYRTAIFYTTSAQREAAEASKQALDASGRFPAPVVTPVFPAAIFYDAEEYHQDFHIKNPTDYKKDRSSSGRDEFIKKYWGDEYWALFA